MEAVTSSLPSHRIPVLLRHRPYGGLHPHLASMVVKLPFSHQALSSRGHGRSAIRPKAGLQKQEQREEEDEEEELKLVSKVTSAYNEIMIVDTPTSRMLILDSSYNVHSVLFKDKKWTDSYWDEFASLPPIVPKGPIAILGLGGGTAAHLMLDLWPELQLEGWELDQILIDKARVYFGLSELEKPTEAGGVLNIHIGDALSPSVNIPGGYAGIIVDLFSDGAILPQLKEVTTWVELKKWLMPGGRIMANCGAGELSDADSSMNNPTMKALTQAFPGQISWKRKQIENANYMVLTGAMPDLESWSEMVPNPLSSGINDWIPYE